MHAVERLISDELQPRTVRCRLFHDGIAVQLDPAGLEADRGRVGRGAAARRSSSCSASTASRPRCAIEPYRMGSAFRHRPADACRRAWQ